MSKGNNDDHSDRSDRSNHSNHNDHTNGYKVPAAPQSAYVLPDGSGFAVGSFPLPKDHWIYKSETTTVGPCNVPPMCLRLGDYDHIEITLRRGESVERCALTRREFAEYIRAAGKYAVRSSTMNGHDMDFDPDALIQNLIVGFLGYWTHDGLDGDNSWANPGDVIVPAE